jgi:hypothetical protein
MWMLIAKSGAAKIAALNWPRYEFAQLANSRMPRIHGLAYF